MKKLTAMLLLAISFAGCAYIDQNLRVAPELSVSETNIGHGKKVALRVVDERDDQLIGRRTDGYGIQAAKITTDQDLAELLKDSFTEGLRKKGFEPVDWNDTTTSLKIELRALGYRSSAGLWTAGNMGQATLKAVATQGSGKNYEKTYRGQREIRTGFIGSQETNAKVVNSALSDALQNTFADKELWEFLAE